METINTLVVDDEPLALELVADYVSQTPFLKLVGSCTSAHEAFQRISVGDVQLVFCDIQMHGMTGLTLMKSLRSVGTPPKVVFTTAFPEYALDGFKLDAVDYLLKPFDLGEFMASASKARRLIELESNASGSPAPTSDDYFFVKSEYRLVRVDRRKIVYVEGLKDYIKIVLDGDVKPVLTLFSLKDILAKLEGSNFVRVHRSFIINVDYLSGVEKGQVTMTNGVAIPIGDQYRQAFNDLIGSKVI